jgi:hypothetical protein
MGRVDGPSNDESHGAPRRMAVVATTGVKHLKESLGEIQL